MTHFGHVPLCVLLLGAGEPGLASSAYEDACTGLYSVQKRLCSVEHVYRCDAGGGTVLRNETWDPVDGLATTITTEDGDWIAFDFHAEYVQFVEILETTDPLSFAAVLSTGLDSFDYTMSAMIPDLFVDPVPVRFFGLMRATGQSRTINGFEFEVFEETLTMELNALSMGMTVTSFFDRENRTYMYGRSDMEIFGQIEAITGDVAQIIRPDEPGFLVNTALYDCGELS